MAASRTVRNQTSDRARATSRAWALAFTLVASLAILVGASLYVFRSLRAIPGDAVRGTRDLLDHLESVASAFSQGSVETRFASYATSVTGSNYLQFATLRQTEVFTRTDRATLLWGQLELPEIVVSATAPVEYTAYLDLDEAWHFRLSGERIEVVAPEIRFNKPAIDASEIHYEVRESSLLRDEEVALEQLKAGLTAMSAARARAHLPLIREMGRRKTREFVENWLVQLFSDGDLYLVEVRFADELPSPGVSSPGPRELRARPGQ